MPKPKNKAASELSKRRWSKMTKKARSDAMRRAALIRWERWRAARKLTS